MPETDPLTAFTSVGRENPIDKIRRIARSDNLSDDIADDFSKVTGLESGRSHYGRGGRVKVSPVDPKDGQRAIGFSQIKPSTARSVGVDDPYDEESNIKAGLRYYAQGGNDPIRRRIAYFSGQKSGAVKHYDRTGRIPSGGDFTGTSFKQYIAGTGGAPQVAQDPLTLFTQSKQADPLSTFTQPDIEPQKPAPKTGTWFDSKFKQGKPVPRSYDTRLASDEESRFQQWKQQYAPNDSGADYDLRGAFKAGLTPDPKTGHWPDTFKKPNHPTFSNESMYAVGADATKAGHWQGDRFIPAQGATSRDKSRQVPKGPFAGVQGGVEAIRPNLMGEGAVGGQVSDADRVRQAVSASAPPGFGLLPRAAQEAIGEQIAKGATGLTKMASGAVKVAPRIPTLGIPNPLVEKMISPVTQPARRALNTAASTMTSGAQEMEKQANRPTVHVPVLGDVGTQDVYNVGGGMVASAPSLALMRLGVPAPVAFGLQSYLEAEGRDAELKDVLKETGVGAATGGLFEIPLPARMALLAKIGAKLGIVGGGTYGIEKLTGMPEAEARKNAFTNALFAASGVKSERPEIKAPTQTVPDALQGKLRGGEIDRALANREAAQAAENAPFKVVDKRALREGVNANIQDRITEPVSGTANRPLPRIEESGGSPVASGTPRHVDLQPRRQRGDGKGQFKSESRAQREERVARVSPESIEAMDARLAQARMADREELRKKVPIVEGAQVQGQPYGLAEKGINIGWGLRVVQASDGSLLTSERGSLFYPTTDAQVQHYKESLIRQTREPAGETQRESRLAQVNPAEQAAILPEGGVSVPQEYKPDPSSIVEYRKYVEGQQRDTDIDQTMALLENKESGEVYDRFTRGTATQDDIAQFRKAANDLGISKEHTEDLVASARSVRIPSIAELSNTKGRTAVEELQREASYLEQERSGLPSRLPPKEQFTDDLARRFEHRRDVLYRRIMSLMDEEGSVVNELWDKASIAAKEGAESQREARISQLTDLRENLTTQVRSRAELEDFASEITRLKNEAKTEYDQIPTQPETLLTKEIAHRKYLDLIELDGEANRAVHQLDMDALGSLDWNISGLGDLGDALRDFNSALKGREVMKNVTPLKPKLLSAAAPQEAPKTAPKVSETSPESSVASARPVQGKNPVEGERSFPKTLESTGREGGADRTYQVVGDQEAVDKADARIKEDPEAARQWASDQLEKGSGKEAIATGLRIADNLSTEAAKESDPVKAADKHAQASDLYSKLAARLTESGQEIQAASLAQKYSPSGAALEVQRIVEKVKGEKSKPDIRDTNLARDLAKKYQTADARISELEKQIATLQAGKTIRSPRPSPLEPLKAKLDKAAQDAQLRIAATKAQMEAGVEFRNAGPLPGHIATHLTDYAIIGAAKIAKGGLTFAEWSSEMVRDLGEEIKPHLATIFRASKKHLDEQRATAKEESAQRGATKELAKRGVAPTPENIESLRQEKSKLQAERRQARVDLDRHYRELERKEQSHKLDAVLSLTRDSLLSARGVLRIAMGMGGKQAMDFSSRFVKAGTDVARSVATGGPRTVAAPSFGTTLRTIAGFAERAPSAVKSAVRGKPSEVMPNVHGGPTENTYVNLVTGIMQRIYGGKEAFISSWAYPEALENNARVFSLNDRADGIIKLGETNQRTRDYLAGKISFEGKRNQRLSQSLAKQAANYEVRNKQIVPSMEKYRAQELADSPTELLHSMALQATDRAVYRQPYESKLAQKLGQIGTDSVGGKIARNIVLPFSKRPANNIADNLFGYTGLRVFGEGYKGIRESINGEFGPARVKSFNDAIGKGATGAAVMAVGALLSKKGMLISPLDKDKSKAGSLFINGKYYNISNVPVVGWLLGMGAAYQTDGIANLPKALYRMISEHPLLRSAKDVTDMVEGLKSNKLGEQLSEYAGRQASRLIPAPVKLAAEASDAEERQTKFTGKKADVKENLTAPTKASLPILRRTLPSAGTKGRLSVVDPLYSKPISRRPQGRVIQ